MAEKRSLAHLRARREALIRSMDHNRAQISASLRQVSTQLPEVSAVATWIGAHPALSLLGAFAGGLVVPALLAPARQPVRSTGLLDLLAPVLQDSLRAAVELFAQNSLGAAADPALPTPPRPQAAAGRGEGAIRTPATPI